MQRFKGIEEALKDGKRLTCTCVRGMRIVQIEGNVVVWGYGVHPSVTKALALADEDVRRGGVRDEPPPMFKKAIFVSNEAEMDTQLDCWLSNGGTACAWWDNEEFYFQLFCWRQVEPSRADLKMARKNIETYWSYRRYIYSLRRSSPTSFVMSAVASDMDPELKYAFSYRVTKTAKGPTFTAAMKKAFRAPDRELS